MQGFTLYTTNANVADHLVGARDESHGSEASQALTFCFKNASPQMSCFVIDLFPFFTPPTRFSVSECHQNRVKSVQSRALTGFNDGAVEVNT